MGSKFDSGVFEVGGDDNERDPCEIRIGNGIDHVRGAGTQGRQEDRRSAGKEGCILR